MKGNRYDDEKFFVQYSRITRSQQGLSGADEWHVLRGMLPELAGKRMLDLGAVTADIALYRVVRPDLPESW